MPEYVAGMEKAGVGAADQQDEESDEQADGIAETGGGSQAAGLRRARERVGGRRGVPVSRPTVMSA